MNNMPQLCRICNGTLEVKKFVCEKCGKEICERCMEKKQGKTLCSKCSHGDFDLDWS